MKSLARFSLFTLALFFLASCEKPATYNKISGPTMGTTFNITYQSEGINNQALIQAVQDELQLINQLMSTYIPDSEINQFNAVTDQQCFKFSDKTWKVLLASRQVYLESNGAFDITLGPLISRWGFNAEEYEQKVPSEQEVQKLLAEVGTDKLQFNLAEQCIVKSLPHITINLSTIAKGYGVDQLAIILEKFGIQHYLVDIGGEAIAKGLNPSGQVWRIAVEKPVNLEQKEAIVVNLNNTSIATSGDYRNYFTVNGQRFSHTIDPKTGYPVTHDLTSISVIHPSNMYADAYATAMTVMGAQQAKSFAQKHELPIFTIQRQDQTLSSQSNNLFDQYTQ